MQEGRKVWHHFLSLVPPVGLKMLQTENTGEPPYLPTYWFDAGGKRIAWSEDDKHVLALVGPSKGPMVQVWNAEDGQVIHSFPVTPSLALGENQGGTFHL